MPANIVFVPVDAAGHPAAPGSAGVRMEAFIAGTEPRAMPRGRRVATGVAATP